MWTLKGTIARESLTGCRLYYLFLACFGSFCVVNNFSAAEIFKYLFFTAMKNQGAYSKEKKQLYI